MTRHSVILAHGSIFRFLFLALVALWPWFWLSFYHHVNGALEALPGVRLDFDLGFILRLFAHRQNHQWLWPIILAPDCLMKFFPPSGTLQPTGASLKIMHARPPLS